MAKARTLVLDTRVNVTGEEKLGKLAKQYETTGQKLKGALNPGNLLAGAGIALGAQQVISFFGDAVTAASDMNETVSKTGAILGQEALPGLEAWAEGAAEAFGQSKQLALDGVATFATFGKAAGLAGDDLAGFSTDLVELAADMASFRNTSPEEAIGAIGAALRGESEPIRAYGVLLDDATVRLRAFKLGIIDSIKTALTPQQRVLAVQAELYAQTTDAQGDFARTSGGLAGQQKILAAKLQDVQVEIGEKLLPIMVELVTFLNEDVVPAVSAFSDALSDLESPSAGDIPILGEIEDALNSTQDFALRLNDTVTGMKFKIEDALDETGLSYGELRQRIHVVMGATGLEQEEALARILGAHKRVAGQVATILPQSIKQATSSVGEAADAMGAEIPEGIQAGVAEAVKIAAFAPGDIGSALRENLDDYQDDLDDLVEMAANSVSDLRERQEIEGVLASTGLTDALSSDSTRTKDEAVAFVNDLISDYELLAPGAFAAGELVDPQLADGIANNVGLSEDAAADLASRTGAPLEGLASQSYGWGSSLTANFDAGMRSYIEAIRQTSIDVGDAASSGFRFRSPAPEGPLSDPDVMGGWGEQLVKWFAGGMQAAVSQVHRASMAVATAAVPSRLLATRVPLGGTYGTPGVFRPGVGDLTPGGVTQIFNLQWSGAPPEGKSETEIVRNLQRLMPMARGY